MEAAGQAAVTDGRVDELGKRGEDVAAEYLAGTGLVVLSRNWRCRGGELDLVATDGERLIFARSKPDQAPDTGNLQRA